MGFLSFVLLLSILGFTLTNLTFFFSFLTVVLKTEKHKSLWGFDASLPFHCCCFKRDGLCD